MNDYIIAVDRDGQPYIAHAWGQRGANANHKYIAKIGEGAKARYFYTQEQLRAFQQGTRQGVQNTANKAKEKASDAVGRVRENSTLLNVGNQYRSAKQAHQNSKSSDPQKAKWGKEGYESNNTLGGKAYKAQQKAKDNLKSTKDRMKEDFRNNKEKASEKIKDKVGYDERERRDAAVVEAEKTKKDYERAQLKAARETDKNPMRTPEQSEKWREAQRAEDVAKGKSERADNERYNAQKAYDKTLLGVAEKVLKNKENKNATIRKAANDYLEAYNAYEKALKDPNVGKYEMEQYEEHALKATEDFLKVQNKKK